MITQDLNGAVGFKVAAIGGNESEMEIILSNCKKYTFYGKGDATLIHPELDNSSEFIKREDRITMMRVKSTVDLVDNGLAYRTVLEIKTHSGTLEFRWDLLSTEYISGGLVAYTIE